MVIEGIRSGLRLTWRQPALSMLVVLILGLGIGLTVVLYSVIYGALLRPLPFEGSERLVAVANLRVDRGRVEYREIDAADFLDWRGRQSSFEGMAAFEMFYSFVTGDETGTETYVGAAVSAGFFELVGVRPMLGRGFREADESPAAPRVAVIGHRVWERLFGADPQVIGKDLRVNHRLFTIVGVMPEGFSFPHSQDIWTIRPLNPAAARGQMGTVSVVAKLDRSSSAARAQAELRALTRRQAEEPVSDEATRLEVVVEPYAAVHTDRRLRKSFAPMLAAVLGVLLIACTNVANLLLARGIQRRHEAAIALALGTSRLRLMGHTLLETSVLAAIAGGLGLLLARGGIAVVNRMLEPSGLLRGFWVDVRLETEVVLFAVGLSILAALAAGILPSLWAFRTSPAQVLRDGAGGLSRKTGFLGRALVVTEVAVCCGLLVACGLMIRTVVHLGAFDPGFHSGGVLTARVSIAQRPDGDPLAFFDELTRRLGGLGPVRRVAFASAIPTRGSYWTELETQGRPEQGIYRARRLVVTPGFFDTFGVPIVTGRDFAATDDASAERVAIVNRSFARRFFRGEDPIGRRVRAAQEEEGPWMTVVGTVPDLVMGAVDDGRSAAALYQPFSQQPEASMEIAVRVAGDPRLLESSLCKEVTATDRLAACFYVATMDEVLRQRRWIYDFIGTLLTVFGASALLLAMVGLYGVLTLSTRHRVRDYAVRLALGASSRDLIRHVLGTGLTLVTIGLALGLSLAGALSRLLSSLLFGVRPWDPLVSVLVAALVLGCGLLAGLAPAHRTARVDPMSSLKAL